MKHLLIFFTFLFNILSINAAKQTDREYWAEQAYRLAAPVLEPMSRGCTRKCR